VIVTGALSRIEIWDADRWRHIDTEAEQSLTAARPGLDDIY
jgi:DNA-binding transcriptional regulator/RsmH inhibitor MraZ